MTTITVILKGDRPNLYFKGNVKILTRNSIERYTSISLHDDTGYSVTRINNDEISSIIEYYPQQSN